MQSLVKYAKERRVAAHCRMENDFGQLQALPKLRQAWRHRYMVGMHKGLAAGCLAARCHERWANACAVRRNIDLGKLSDGVLIVGVVNE